MAAAQAFAQQKAVTGKVTNESGLPIADVQVVIRGTSVRTATNTEGNYLIQAAPGQVLQYRFIGTSPVERTVGADNVINVQLRRVATNLDAVTVVALGQTASQRSLGTAQQLVQGEELAQTQRLNFVNALQGRVAGVSNTQNDGEPGSGVNVTGVMKSLSRSAFTGTSAARGGGGSSERSGASASGSAITSSGSGGGSRKSSSRMTSVDSGLGGGPAGDGMPVKKLPVQTGFSVSSSAVLKRASRKAVQTE